jgi:hypothetical protein
MARSSGHTGAHSRGIPRAVCHGAWALFFYFNALPWGHASLMTMMCRCHPPPREALLVNRSTEALREHSLASTPITRTSGSYTYARELCSHGVRVRVAPSRARIPVQDAVAASSPAPQYPARRQSTAHHDRVPGARRQSVTLRGRTIARRESATYERRYFWNQSRSLSHESLAAWAR